MDLSRSIWLGGSRSILIPIHRSETAEGNAHQNVLARVWCQGIFKAESGHDGGKWIPTVVCRARVYQLPRFGAGPSGCSG